MAAMHRNWNGAGHLPIFVSRLIQIYIRRYVHLLAINNLCTLFKSPSFPDFSFPKGFREALFETEPEIGMDHFGNSFLSFVGLCLFAARLLSSNRVFSAVSACKGSSSSHRSWRRLVRSNGPGQVGFTESCLRTSCETQSTGKNALRN